MMAETSEYCSDSSVPLAHSGLCRPVRSSVVDRSSVVSNNDEEEMRGFEDVDPGHDSSHVFKRKMSGEYGF